jgi:hypothetical protein
MTLLYIFTQVGHEPIHVYNQSDLQVELLIPERVVCTLHYISNLRLLGRVYAHNTVWINSTCQTQI